MTFSTKKLKTTFQSQPYSRRLRTTCPAALAAVAAERPGAAFLAVVGLGFGERQAGDTKAFEGEQVELKVID